MRVEGDEGLRRIGVRMLGEYRLSSLAALAPVGIVQTNTRGKIRPAELGTLTDLLEVLKITHDIAVAPLIDPMLGGEKPAIRVEADAVRVAQPPGDNLKIAAVGITAQDRPIALDVPMD
jgi:hypothetical protein